MSRPKLLDVFDDSLSSGERAYNRLLSHVNVAASGETLTFQSNNTTLEDGATLVLQVILAGATATHYVQAGLLNYDLIDSSGYQNTQTFPLNTRLVVTFDTTNHKAYLLTQSVPTSIILSEEEELGILTEVNAATLDGHTLSEFAMKTDAYNAYFNAEVIVDE